MQRGLELDADRLSCRQGDRVQWHPLLETVQQCPAAEVEVVRAGVEQNDGLALRCGADGLTRAATMRTR